MDRNQETRSKIQDLRSELSLAEVEGVIGDAKEFLRRIWPFLKLGIPLSTIIAVIGAGETQNVNAEAAKAFQLRESKSMSSEDILGSNRGKIESLGLSKKTLELLVTEAQSGEPPIGRGRITSSRNVNLRSETNTNSQILRVLLPGTELFILENPTANSPWYRIRTDDGSEGYIHSDLMESIDATPEAAPEPNTAVGTEPAPAGTQDAPNLENTATPEIGRFHNATVISPNAALRSTYQENYTTVALEPGQVIRIEGTDTPYTGSDGAILYQASIYNEDGTRGAWGFVRRTAFEYVFTQSTTTGNGPSLESTNSPQDSNFRIPEWLGTDNNFPRITETQIGQSNAILTLDGQILPLGTDISSAEVNDRYFSLFSSTLPDFLNDRYDIPKENMTFVSGFIIPDKDGNYIRRQVIGGVDGYFIRVGTPRGVNAPIGIADLAGAEESLLDTQQYFFAFTDPNSNDPEILFNGGQFRLSFINQTLAEDWNNQRLTQISFFGLEGQSIVDIKDGIAQSTPSGDPIFEPVPLVSAEFVVMGNQRDFALKNAKGAWVTL